jgi:hypothetical protein
LKRAQPKNKSFAIITDIHANLEALTAVLADIDERGVREIVCLATSSVTARIRRNAWTSCASTAASR